MCLRIYVYMYICVENQVHSFEKGVTVVEYD